MKNKVLYAWLFTVLIVVSIFSLGVYFKVEFFENIDKIGLILIVLLLIALPIKDIMYTRDN